MSKAKSPALTHLAHAIRIISVPPVMVAALILFLYFLRPDEVFPSAANMAVSLCLLAVLPVLAYPLSVLIPPIRRKGRDGQRSLAMYLSAVGYLSVFVYGCVADVGRPPMLIYTGYFLSVILILVFNKLLHVRASGHACSITGPLVYSAYFLGHWGILIGTALWCVIFWASLRMKRHTVREYLLGTMVCLVSFAVGLVFFY